VVPRGDLTARTCAQRNGITAVREAHTDQAHSWFDDAYHAMTESLGQFAPAMRCGVDIPHACALSSAASTMRTMAPVGGFDGIGLARSKDRADAGGNIDAGVGSFRAEDDAAVDDEQCCNP
jgi:hypothetical protein